MNDTFSPEEYCISFRSTSRLEVMESKFDDLKGRLSSRKQHDVVLKAAFARFMK